jgi:twitching motility two-component system response regulator PilH
MGIKKIMVVDDSPTDLAFIGGIVNRSGYEGILVGSGEAAIRRARIDQPEVIVMDLMMPGINGFEATRMLSRDEATRHIPIIICTKRKQETDRIWGLRQGARDFVNKPVSEIDLLEKIEALLTLDPLAA